MIHPQFRRKGLLVNPLWSLKVGQVINVTDWGAIVTGIDYEWRDVAPWKDWYVAFKTTVIAAPIVYSSGNDKWDNELSWLWPAHWRIQVYEYNADGTDGPFFQYESTEPILKDALKEYELEHIKPARGNQLRRKLRIDGPIA
jgi:hypothetical protein